MTSDALEPEFIDVLCEDEHAHWPVFSDASMDAACEGKGSFLFVTKPGRVTCPKCKHWLEAHPWSTTWEAR